MADLSEKILQYLDNCESVGTLNLARIFGEDHQKIIGALKSIQANGDFVIAEAQSQKHFELTEEGVQVAENGNNLEKVLFSVISRG